MGMSNDFSNGPLSGIRVLEIGSTVAGPFCGRLFADFGAEVIKVEPREGDLVRSMGKRQKGKSLYAASIFRGKRLVVLDLRREDARGIVKRMVPKCDIVIENFRPGTLEKWGLDFDSLSAVRPGLIMVRISGFGQSGPYRDRPGYGIIGEAASGLREITGDPDRPPARVSVSLTDYITGLYATMGAVMALRVRDATGQGQVIDATLYESAFSFIEPHVPAYSNTGFVATRTGSKLPNNVPNDLYPTNDGRYVQITAVSDPLFARLAELIGKPELATDPRFATSVARSDNEAELDRLIAEWTGARSLDEAEKALMDASIPASRIFNMRDIFDDPHFRARGMLAELPDPDLGKVTVAGIVPKLSRTPGKVRWLGRKTGEDTRAVLTEIAGLSASEIAALESAGAIWCGGADAAEPAPRRAKA